MGMFDKDKVFAPDGQLEQWAELGSEFVLWDCWIQDENFEFDPTAKGDEGKAAMSHLVVSKKVTPDEKKTVSSLGGVIAEKVKAKEDGDLPAVVRLESVPASKKGFNDAKVLRFIEPFQPGK